MWSITPVRFFLTLNRTNMVACWFLCNPPHGTSLIRIPLVRFTADQTGVKHTFLCLPPTFSSVRSSPGWLLTGSRCICPTFMPPLLPSPLPPLWLPPLLISSPPPGHFPLVLSSHLSPFPFISTPRLIYFHPPSFILLSHSSDLLAPPHPSCPPIQALMP